MHIRPSTPEDLPRIMEIYAQARAFMAAHGNPNQWGPTNWPPEDLIRQDIEDGKSFVCTEFVEITRCTEEFAKISRCKDEYADISKCTEEYADPGEVCTASQIYEHIIATFFYTHGYRCEPTYNDIEDGNWIGNDTYGVVHRIATDHTVHGAGAFCLNWAFRKCQHLRIDTHPDNYVMQNLLKKLGLEHCGTIYVREDNDPRLAYEKVLRDD